MKHQKVEQRNECIDYFKKCPVWKRVFTGFRDKYLSYGRFAGKIVIKKLSAEEIEELEGFFGQNFHGQRSVTISAEKFAKALADSRFKEIQPLEILTGYFGMPLYAKVEIKEMHEQKITEIEGEFKKIFEFTPAYYQLEKFKTLIRNKRNDPMQQDMDDMCRSMDFAEWKRWLWLCAKIYNELPYRYDKEMYLAFFAAKITGNPHAFDAETSEGKILYQIIEIDLESRNQQIEDSKLFPAYKKQKSYLLAGILINDISNYAMLYHVQALKKDGTLHGGIEGFFREKDILQLSLNVIARLSQIRCRDNEIYIVENPSVFAMICEEKSCMCMNGQPRLSCLMVLELLAKSGTHVFYSGDLDPEGMLIAQKLSRFYPGRFTYWHMAEEDYKVCQSQEILSERRLKMLEKITDERLLPVVNNMVRCRKAGYQENLHWCSLDMQ